MNRVGGQLLNVFSNQEVNDWVEVMKKLPPLEIHENTCRGVDENNLLNLWFHKMIFSRINQIFGNDIHLVFGMLLNERKPWGVHTDAYHVKDHTDRKSAISFLIPYSVDHDTNLVTKSQTIVFDQTLRDNDEWETLPECETHETSAMKIYNQHLSHNKIDRVKKLTVQGQYQWMPGSLIYWDSYHLHDSDNFIASGHTSKQAIVMHTYYQV
jgi:hypothetical protein